MDGMPTHLPRHAAARHSSAAAWVVLVAMGGTTMTFNVWHDVTTGRMPLPLAILTGVVPIVVSMGLSHIVATHNGGFWLKAVTFGVMIGSMALSVGATGAVVRQAEGPLWWLFGVVVDAAALVALRVIMSPGDPAEAPAGAIPEAARGTAPDAIPDATPGATAVPSGMPAQEPGPVPAEEPEESQPQEPRRRATGPMAALAKDPEAERARAAYRKSARAGQPLSDRALGEMFGRSRTWGGNRIRECDAGPRLASKTG